ncbi:hypothetical protein GN958_ATG13965 [Phytophthora infestans]|uniref:Uncharacterized protein n=1 Tax=Phytophthora infestans TaxID=4787 RepID=A0A8S9U7C5_PHYIN|nr:hypothetical protein GN958_ATG13965 [Phytophthora infestans]
MTQKTGPMKRLPAKTRSALQAADEVAGNNMEDASAASLGHDDTRAQGGGLWKRLAIGHIK